MTWATTQPSLLARLRDSDDGRAWTEFDRRYGELIVRYAQSRGLKRADAEDVRQIVLLHFAKSVRSASGFRYAPERGRFRSYLGKSVRTAIMRHFGRPERRLFALENDVLAALADNEPENDEVWEREWVRHHLRVAMQVVRQTFAPRSVMVFDLLLAGRSTREAAESMEMTEEAVHKVKQRIRDRLRTLVATQLDEEEEPNAVQ